MCCYWLLGSGQDESHHLIPGVNGEDAWLNRESQEGRAGLAGKAVRQGAEMVEEE